MSATLVKRSYHEDITERWHSFEWDDCSGAGFSFPVDEHGNYTNTNEASLANLAMCKMGVGDNGVKIHDHGIQTNTRTVWHPAQYKCECGRSFWGDGDTQCKCGRWYNAGGQELDAHAMVCSVYAAGYDCMCFEND